MIWLHKSIANKREYYKFWNNRFIETRLKVQRGHLTVLRVVYVPTEGREELNKELYEMLHKILDKANKSDNIMLTGT